MKIAILGFARDGRAAYDYWQQGAGAAQGNEITICDSDASIDPPEGVSTQLGEHWLENLDRFDVLFRTAGLPPSKIAAANPGSPDILSKVTGNVSEFMKVCPTKNIIGVTGTKGKGTTSTLIAKLLEADGKRAFLGGNIGIPALELLKENIQPDDWVVLEQSSFQLIDQKVSPHIAVCLMVVSEHMDWHKDMDEYVTAKKQIFAHQKADDLAIYYSQNQLSEQIASVSPGIKIPYMKTPGTIIQDEAIVINGQAICKTAELKLLGQHNWQNVCAAVTAFWYSQQPADSEIPRKIEAMRSVLTSFSGLEHRLEFVRELDGVKYFDDSFGTTPETAIVAIQAFEQPKVVILGGSDKGSDYIQLARTVAESNVKCAVLIGEMGPKIGEALRAVGFHYTIAGGGTMAEIVEVARRQASLGDVVLLSTACASFGLFKDYKDRGEQFKQAVQALV
ncbi:MAG: UDP-N-acetylmuramoyl-L-alanine--D-glutamate ligase [Candidatus Saccharimonadales bacterium]